MPQLIWVLGNQVVAHYEFPMDEIRGSPSSPAPETQAVAPSAPPVESPAGDVFSIRCLLGGKASVSADKLLPGASAGPEFLVFEITDVQNGRVGRYRFYGVDLGIAASLDPDLTKPEQRGVAQVPKPKTKGGIGVGVTIFGPGGKPTQFITTRPQRLEDFGTDVTGTFMGSAGI